MKTMNENCKFHICGADKKWSAYWKRYRTTSMSGNAMTHNFMSDCKDILYQIGGLLSKRNAASYGNSRYYQE